MPAAACCSAEHQDNLHHSRMADCICADTDKGNCVGEVAQNHIEEFEECLYKEHSLSGLRKCIALFSTIRSSGSFKKIARSGIPNMTTITPTAGALWPLNRRTSVTARAP